MFSLLITVFSIALVVILVAAVMYFGGNEAFSKGKEEAAAAQALNEITQIEGAMFSYQVHEGTFPSELELLVDKGHLTQLPNGWAGGAGDLSTVGVRLLDLKDTEQESRICTVINERLGLGEDYLPQCTDVIGEGSAFKGCCLGAD